jgi:HEAT repeat protein
MSSLDILLGQIDDPSNLSSKDETYDLALARDLGGADRTKLLSRLIDAARGDDQRAVLTLGYIGAVETLPALLPLARANNPMAATARRAVVLLGHGSDVVDLIARDAVGSPAKMVRVAAVMDLAKVGGDKALDALEQALGDSEFEIRELAWQGLVTLFELDPVLRGPDGKRGLMTHVELLSVWLGSQLAALRQLGLHGMRDLVAKLRRRASPASLGIKWIANPAPETFQKVRLALFVADSAYPVDDIKRLSGSPRQWAETMILLRLEHQDARVPETMTRLGAEWTVPVLEEVARSASTPNELRDALTESIRSLRAS